jgi:hypothetical protein
MANRKAAIKTDAITIENYDISKNICADNRTLISAILAILLTPIIQIIERRRA